MKTPQTPIIIAIHILSTENPQFKRNTKQHDNYIVLSSVLRQIKHLSIKLSFYFKLKSLVKHSLLFALHSQLS